MYEDPAREVDLEWMPAHTAAWQVGKSRKSDGTKLTLSDRHGNDVADELAKKGAKLHRVPWHVRNNMEIAERVALRAALQLGVTTHAANNVTEVVFRSDGTRTTKNTCDSNGDPKSSALKKRKEQLAKAAEEPKKKDEGINAHQAQGCQKRGRCQLREETTKETA